MTNKGGRINLAGVWQQAIPANGIPSGSTAIIQNTSFGTNPNKFDVNGLNSGPAILVWPFAANPNQLANADGTTRTAGVLDGAFLATKPGDPVKFSDKQTDAVWVMCPESGGVFAAGIE